MGSPVDFEGPVLSGPDSRPFGTSFLPDVGLGVDLSEHAYEEDEYLVSGTANLYAYDAKLERQVHTAGVPYTTRILVRRQADPGAFGGVVQVDPLHPSADNPNVWTQLWHHIVGNSQAWVGVTVVPANAALMATLYPDRYGALSLTDEGSAGTSSDRWSPRCAPTHGSSARRASGSTSRVAPTPARSAGCS